MGDIRVEFNASAPLNVIITPYNWKLNPYQSQTSCFEMSTDAKTITSEICITKIAFGVSPYLAQVQSGRKVIPTELGITLIKGYQLIDPELCKPQAWPFRCNREAAYPPRSPSHQRTLRDPPHISVPSEIPLTSSLSL